MKTQLSFHAAILVAGAQVLTAAVITNPTTVAGPGVGIIDPTGAEELDSSAIGSTPKATIEALAGINVLQTVTGFGALTAAAASVSNYVDFTSGTLPDISFTASTSSGTLVTGSGFGSSPVLNTSAGSAFAARHSLAGTMNITIAFGTYDTASGTLANNMGVSALAFSLANLRENSSVVVTFFGTDGSTVLSTQTMTGVAETGSDGSGSRGGDYYFGLAAGSTYATAIGSVQIVRTTTTDTLANSSIGVDDIAFTSGILIPEPSHLALAALGAGLIGLRRRR